MGEPKEKFWESEWKKDPELMALVNECNDLADETLRTFQEFDAIVAWAQRIADENSGTIVEKHFDCIRIEFEHYPKHLQEIAREHRDLIVLRDATGDQPAEMAIELGWGWD